jgi:hypothetical protein
MEFLPSKKFMQALGGVIALALFFVALSHYGAPNISLGNPSDSLTPNASLSAWKNATATLSYANTGDNLTLGAAQKLLAQASFLQTQNGSATPEQISKIANSVAGTINAGVDEHHYDNEIIYITSPNPEVSFIHTYGNLIATGIGYYGTFTLDEVRILADAMNNQNPAALKTLAERVQKYRELGEYLKKIPVPEAIWKDHLELMNMTWALSIDVENLKEAVNDPLRGIIGIEMFVKHSEMRVAALKRITAYIRASGTTYDSKELGRYLLR